MLYQPTTRTLARPHAASLGGEATLHVCTVITNYVRYASRYKLFDEFVAQTAGAHVQLWTVEVAYGNRPFVVTERDNPYHLQLRTAHDIWHKENALNLLHAHILSEVPEAEYFMDCDADITFARSDWAYETLQQLQHYHVVQPFSDAMDVGPKHQLLSKTIKYKSFVWAYYNDPGFQTGNIKYGYTSDGHPGYAWAYRKSALDTFGGLIDFAICGGGDRHMACGLIGTIERSTPYIKKTIDDLSPEFRNDLFTWQDRALLLQKNIGYIDGLVLHHWHGRKKDRQYGDRWKIYTENAYNPRQDLKRDAQGLHQLAGNKPKLRDDLRSFQYARNEDSIDEV